MTNKITENIVEYGDSKYGHPIGIIILIKVLAVCSLNVNNIIPLSILLISLSGNFKTRTSVEIQKIFPPDHHPPYGDLHLLGLQYNQE